MQILYILEPCKLPKDHENYVRQSGILHARLDDQLKYLEKQGHIANPKIISSDQLGFPIGTPTSDIPIYRIDLTVNDLEKKISELRLLSENWSKFTKSLNELNNMQPPSRNYVRYSEIDSQLIDKQECGKLVSLYDQLIKEGQRFFGNKDVDKWADELNRLSLPEGMQSQNKHKIWDKAIDAIKTSSYWMARSEVKDGSFVNGLKDIVVLNTINIPDK